jgi:hypothetical protein
MILTLNEFDNDRDCPELYDAFNATPIDSAQETNSDGPQDVDEMDAPTYSLYLAYGDSFGD